MNLMTLASNLIWVPLSLAALGLIAWDLRDRPQGRLVVAVVIALTVASVGMFAAEISWEVCSQQCPVMDWVMWAITGCWAC